MALTSQQLLILDVVRAVDDAGVFALAGGGAINALGVADRETHDLDLFTPALDALDDVVDLVISELRRRSIDVEASVRRPGWRRIDERNSLPPWNDHPISRADLDGWLLRFQVPDAPEMALFDAPPDSS